MAKTSERLKMVLKVANLRQQQAAEKLGQELKKADDVRLQLQQLESYLDDYNRQFIKQDKHPVNAAQLGNYTRFFSDLDDALKSQSKRSEMSERALEQARQRWQNLYSREKSMESLISDKEQLENIEEEKKIQRDLDDKARLK